MQLRSWHLLRLSIAGLLACQVPSTAFAQHLFTIEGLSGNCYHVDPHSGSAVFQGSLGTNQDLWTGMAKDNLGRLFAARGYYNSPYSIHEIDPYAVTATMAVQTSFLGVTALAFGPHDLLYVINDRDAPLGLGRDDLWCVDLTTGIATFIGATGATGILGLAFGQGALWAYDAHQYGLVRLDLATGALTVVNPGVPGRVYLCATMCFSDTDVLYAAMDSLFVMDTMTGVPGFVGEMPFSGFGYGMEFLPNQPAPFSLGVQGTVGGPMSAFVAGATPGGTVGLFGAVGLGATSSLPAGRPCAGTVLALNSVHLAQIARAGPLGRVQFQPVIVPVEARGHVEVQAVDLSSCRTSNPVTIFF